MWGEPFELHDDEKTADRIGSLKAMGITNGALVHYGTVGKEGLFVWERPETAATVNSYVNTTFGIVLAIDASSDPSTDWLFLYMNAGHGTVIGWVPAPLITVL